MAYLNCNKIVPRVWFVYAFVNQTIPCIEFCYDLHVPKHILDTVFLGCVCLLHRQESFLIPCVSSFTVSFRAMQSFSTNCLEQDWVHAKSRSFPQRVSKHIDLPMLVSGDTE